MMDSRLNKFSCALGNIDSQYIEEALCFNPRTKILWKKRVVLFPKMSAACLILLIILGFSLAVFALSKMTISWRDIFSSNQNIINDADEAVIESQQTKVVTQIINSESEAARTKTNLNDESVENIEIDIIKAISDERALYLLYSVKANDGAVLSPEGRFKSFDMLFPGKMMSGAYQQYFIERHEGIQENELEGVIYADWQYDLNIGELAMNFTDWQEEKMFNDIVADVDIADIVANSEENLHLPMLYTGHQPEYLLQPGNIEYRMPYGDVSICSADWEDGVLQIVFKGSNYTEEWSTGQNWFFVDTRTDEIIIPEHSAYYHVPEDLGYSHETSDQSFFWNFVLVDEKVLPYLEMHWGGKSCFETVLSGQWNVVIEEIPVSVKSELLAENMELNYAGYELLVRKIECSKLSLAVYFEDIIDSTTGILNQFKVYDARGNLVECDWGFTANANANECMIWTRFKEPIEPENICNITFNNAAIFSR